MSDVLFEPLLTAEEAAEQPRTRLREIADSDDGPASLTVAVSETPTFRREYRSPWRFSPPRIPTIAEGDRRESEH